MIIEKTYWRDASGFKWDLKDMKEDHILNSIAYVADKISKFRFIFSESAVHSATKDLLDKKINEMRGEINILDAEIARRAVKRLDGKV